MFTKQRNLMYIITQKLRGCHRLSKNPSYGANSRISII